MNKELINNLYIAVNEMMDRVGATGKVESLDPETGNVMDALHDLDGGVFKQEGLFKDE